VPELRRRALLVAVYSLAAAVLTWPLAASLTSRLGALQGPGDPYLNLWILGRGLQAWTTDPLSVLTGRVFDANIFFPAEGTLAYSDHFLLHALTLAPIYAITGDAVLCYNLLLLGSIAASGLAMHALVRAVTGTAAAAYAAGLAWACWPYHTAHLLHIQLELVVFMPLALLFLHRVVAKRQWRDAAMLAAFSALQAMTSVYYGVMTAVALMVSALTLAVATGQWRSKRLWSRLAAAGAIAAALAAPVLVPYVRSQQAEGFGRTLFEASNHSASLRSFAQVPPVNLVYGRTGLLAPRPPRPGERDRGGVEEQLFPGLVVIVLAAAGFFAAARSDARPLALSAAALTVTGVVLAMGPEGFRTLYALLHDSLYGFQAIRAPARFAVVAMLGLVLLAALGMRRVAAGYSIRAAPAVIIGLLCLEYLNAPLPLAAAPARRTDIGQWLAHEPTPGAVLHLPLTIDIENTPFMVQSLEHGRPIVNGYSGHRPAFFSALVDSVADFPSSTALAALREIDVRFVVSPSSVGGADTERSPLVERARFADGHVYELRWTPLASAALDDTTAPLPPAPGAAPFAPGESARYDVRWDGGPVNLPAGTAMLRVLAGGPGRDWQFEAAAETAGWVTPFFPARDRFVTTADATLLPLEHVREIREGRRRMDRTYLFDRTARHVRVGDTRAAALAADAMTLPLGSPAARDGLSALYYIRTLPAPATAALSIPINDAGSAMLLETGPGVRETIDHGGGPTAALRLEPRLLRRIERRRPIGLTIWLSDDERRIPLRVIVDAGFGRVRLELTDYSR
jgi:hypothetical protein